MILQEIGQALDTPDDMIFDQFQETALPDQPLGRPVLGTADIGRGDRPRRPVRLSWRATTRPRTWCCRRRAASSTTRSSSWPRSISARCRARRPTPRRRCRSPMSAATAARRATLEQAHLVLGCQGIGYRDPDYYATAVYSTLFGGGMSSRLFQRIREERGPGLRHPLLQRGLCRRRPVRHLCRHRRGRSRRAGPGGVRGVRRRGRYARSSRSWCAPATRSRPAP